MDLKLVNSNSENHSDCCGNGKMSKFKIEAEMKNGSSKKISGRPDRFFAPLNIPFERRMQTLAALIWASIFFLGVPVGHLFVIYIFFFTNWWLISLMYITWIYIDRNTSKTGGRRSNAFRQWIMWKYYRDYFPIKLIKTVDLDPKKNYLFASHPHGILCSGAFACFATEACNVSEVFPGLKMHVLTLNMNFLSPFFREFATSFGGCSVSKESIRYLMNQPNGGNVGVLVPGGAEESLDCHPGSYSVRLKSRKGFIKIALQNGASLVPVFSFGETEIYDQFHNPEGSTLRKIQNKAIKILSFAPILVKGRGIFQYSFGILPRRVPIVTIVGAPLEVKHIIDPTQEEIDILHEKYLIALSDLFYKYRDEYAYPNAEFKIF